MYFFSAKAFLILAIVTAKIVYLGFLVSYTSGVVLIIWMSKVLNELWSFTVSYLAFCLVLVLNIKLVLDSGLGFLSIFWIVKY